jgi:hypothetical protein
MSDLVEALRLLHSGAAWVDGETAVTLEAAADEIERLRAEVASLRLTLGMRTFSADVPEPIGCPAPGACVQVAEIERLRAALDAATRMLHKAGEQFAFYATERAKKGTADGDTKAATNQQWAQRCFNAHDAALAVVSGAALEEPRDE